MGGYVRIGVYGVKVTDELYVGSELLVAMWTGQLTVVYVLPYVFAGISCSTPHLGMEDTSLFILNSAFTME